SATDVPLVHLAAPPEAAPMCPWREPEADMRRFFPGAIRHETETRILSGQRLELMRRLGRPPLPDEHSAYLHRIYTGDQLAGTILTRRVRGQYGAIEIVLAVGTGGRVRGVRLQRLREPEAIAKALQSPRWLAAFQGRTAENDWHPDRDLSA